MVKLHPNGLRQYMFLGTNIILTWVELHNANNVMMKLYEYDKPVLNTIYEYKHKYNWLC